MIRRAGAALLAAVALLAVAGCQVRTEVGVQVDGDGSGTVTVAVGLDDDALARVPDLEEQLRLDDLLVGGWDVTGPAPEADGMTWIRATKGFATPGEAGRVLAEVAGDDGPFRDFDVTRERGFARTTYGFRGTVDLGGGLEAFGDDGLAAALDGEPLGEDVAAIEARIGAAVDDAFTFRVAVRLPGELTSTNAPAEAGNGAVWEPRLSEPGPIELVAGSEERRTTTIVLLVVAALAGIAAVAVLLRFPGGRARSRGRHAAGAGPGEART